MPPVCTVGYFAPFMNGVDLSKWETGSSAGSYDSFEDELRDRREKARPRLTREWLAAHPFPGHDADKIPWLESMQAQYRASNNFLESTKAAYIVRELLLQYAPNTLFLELRVPCNQLVALKDWTPVTQAFVLPPNTEYQGEATWPAYCQYLLDSSNDDATVVLDHVEGSKNDKVDTLLHDFFVATGLQDLQHDGSVAIQRAKEQACNDWKAHKLLGENLYLQSKNGHIVVPLDLSLQERSATGMANRVFVQELQVEKEQLKAKGLGKTFVIVPKQRPANNKDQEVLYSKETHYVVWLSDQYDVELERMTDRFQGYGREVTSVKRRLIEGRAEGTMDSANLMVQMFGEETWHMKYHVAGHQNKICNALALVMASSNNYYWMNDNDCWDDVLGPLISDFGDYVRTNLLKKSDQQLWLGKFEQGVMPGDPPRGHGLEQDMSESRLGLYALFDSRASLFHDPQENDCFKWRPAKPRKRRAAAKENDSGNVKAEPVDKKTKH